MNNKYCVVPQCFNSTVKTPEKLFFYVPKDPKSRKKWMTVIRRKDSIGPKTVAFCCEDHFDVEKDMENYIKFKLIGGLMKLRPDVVPHKFECQKENNDKPEISAVNVKKRNIQIKRSRKMLRIDEEPIPPTADAHEYPEVEVFVASYKDETVTEDPLSVGNDDDSSDFFETAACRICLATDVRMISIADTPLQTVYEKFTNCALRNEQRPISACYMCHAQLRNSYKLMVTSIDAEMALTELLATHPELTRETVSKIDRAEMNLSPSLCVSPIHHTEIPSSFEVPVKSEQVDQDEKDPEASPQLTDAVPKVEIGMDEDMPENFVETVMADDEGPEDDENEDPTDDVASNGERETCKLCSNPHIIGMDAHKPYACFLCQKRFMHKGEMGKHMSTHKKDNHFNCQICQRPFTSTWLLKLHMRSHTGEKPYSCEVCGKGFATSSRLKIHSRVHTGEKPFQCSVCSKTFTVQLKLKYHMRVHTGEKPYKCEICPARFTYKRGLNKHVKTHTGTKPYECVVCSFGLPSKSALTRHLRVHTGEKPYECGMCQRRYKTKSHLKAHIRTHTGEKPYECSVCQWRFKTKSNLKTHIKTHTGEKPYKCDKCGRAFYFPSALKMHMRKHECSVCGKRFKWPATLKAHRLKKHSDEKPAECGN